MFLITSSPPWSSRLDGVLDHIITSLTELYFVVQDAIAASLRTPVGPALLLHLGNSPSTSRLSSKLRKQSDAEPRCDGLSVNR